MSQDNQDNLLNHNYDGIQEYDNALPNWWLVTFFGTIIFAFIYFIHYTYGGGDTQAQELAQDLANLPKTAEKIWSESDLENKMKGPEVLNAGAAVFKSKCSSCHGTEGQGVVGPNLTDRFWIHGRGQRADIIQVVTKGVLDKGMPAWDGLISDDEVVAVTAYVYSLKGKTPANPKAPQGEEVKD